MERKKASDFPQELLDIFHEYVHGDIDRRTFLQRANKFAVGGLTTAEILYRMPDHPALLQTYVWQDYDLCPKFPVLNKFLAFWLEKLEGPLHSVRVAKCGILCPLDLRHVGKEFVLH